MRCENCDSEMVFVGQLETGCLSCQLCQSSRFFPEVSFKGFTVDNYHYTRIGDVVTLTFKVPVEMPSDPFLYEEGFSFTEAPQDV